MSPTSRRGLNTDALAVRLMSTATQAAVVKAEGRRLKLCRRAPRISHRGALKSSEERMCGTGPEAPSVKEVTTSSRDAARSTTRARMTRMRWATSAPLRRGAARGVRGVP